MDKVRKEIEEVFGNKIRVRATGILVEGNKILLIKHLGLGTKGIFWAPPGGGVDFFESSEKTLQREFEEETGLKVSIEDFLFINELIYEPLHTFELFFLVKKQGGELKMGADPEMKLQMIQEMKFWSFEEISKEDNIIFHNILTNVNSIPDLLALKGYFRYENHQTYHR